MGVTNLTIKTSAGVNYTSTTDSSVDWSAVTYNTYFYDKSTNLVYYKNSGGTIIGAYDTFTGGSVSSLTATTISASTYQNLPVTSTITGGTYNFTGNTLTLNSNDGNNITITGFTYERQSDYVYPYFYGGSAPLYTLTSTATWIIKRVDYTTPGSPITLSAIGSWDNRYILIYT